MTETDPPNPEGGRRHRRLDSIVTEVVKRMVEVGVEKAAEAPDNLKALLSDIKVPKEIAGYLLSQIDETKNGLLRVVAKETRDFLEHTNLAGELQKVLTTVQFEIQTTIRFRPNEDRNAEGSAALRNPEVKTEVHVKQDRRPREKAREPKGDE